MDKRIEKILKTDSVARNRIDKARSFATKVMKEVDGEVESMKIETDKRVKEKVDKIKKQQEKILQELEKSNKEENAVICQKFEKIYEEKSQEWIDTIYKNVISD